MPVPRGAIRSGPIILLMGGGACLVNRLVPLASPWQIATVAMQVAAIAWLTAGQLTARYRVPLSLGSGALTAMTILWFGLQAHALDLALAGLCHATAYTGLLFWFGASLLPDREPVITRFARQMRRTMPPDVVRYTRQATFAWCVFFTGQILMSLTLRLAAPETVWSDFVTLWNAPLLTAMILLEYACRSLLFRREQRTGLRATLRALHQLRGAPGGST